jgi:cell wall-associated NlpC family hydrolase
MKLLICALPLLAGVPVAAQVSVSLPRLQRPVVRAALGPISVMASLGSGGIRLHAHPAAAPRRTSAVRNPTRVNASAAGVLATANRYVGTRYRYGGDSPVTGFDCSGFVQYVYGKNGIDLPRTSRQQASAGHAVALGLAALRPGDLLLFASSGNRIDHVAIYVGDNRIVHSSSGAGAVVTDDLTSPRGQWYLKRHVASRRVL